MSAINRQKFLAELAKLLTFMYEEDRQYALEMYERMFDIAEDDEQGLIQHLMSPTRQAVVIARAYNARERKLSVESQTREDGYQETNGTPPFVLAINKIFDDLFPDEDELPTHTEDQVSFFELGTMEEEPTPRKPQMPKAAVLLDDTQEFQLNLDDLVPPEDEAPAPEEAWTDAEGETREEPDDWDEETEPEPEEGYDPDTEPLEAVYEDPDAEPENPDTDEAAAYESVEPESVEEPEEEHIPSYEEIYAEIYPERGTVMNGEDAEPEEPENADTDPVEEERYSETPETSDLPEESEQAGDVEELEDSDEPEETAEPEYELEPEPARSLEPDTEEYEGYEERPESGEDDPAAEAADAESAVWEDQETPEDTALSEAEELSEPETPEETDDEEPEELPDAEPEQPAGRRSRAEQKTKEKIVPVSVASQKKRAAAAARDDEPAVFVENTEQKANVPLLILFLLVAIPVTAALLAGVIVLTVASLGIAVGLIALGAVLIVAAFSGFAVLADVLVLLGAALVALALGLVFLWLAIWLVGEVCIGLVRGVKGLARKWCYKEVPEA